MLLGEVAQQDREGIVVTPRAEELGGEQGMLGRVTGPATEVEGGSVVDFERGAIVLTPRGRPFVVQGEILAAYREAGGKVLIWHGLADPNITPMNAIGYWQAVRDTLHPEPLDGQDGPSNTDPRLDDLIRLFLIPGMYHCDRGEGLGSLDVTTPLMDWVEDGQAPETLFASATEVDARAGRGRPIQRFPYLTVLKPGGDPANPADWQRGRPIDIDPALYRNWAGAEFFKPGFQRFCGFSGLQFVCQP